jgi:hypothetical protein
VKGTNTSLTQDFGSKYASYTPGAKHGVVEGKRFFNVGC